VTTIRIALYGDLDLNVIDGSSIWLSSLAQTLHSGDRVSLTLLLKAPEVRDLITAPLRRLPRLTVVPPNEMGVGQALRPTEALDTLERLDDQDRFDVVFLRGFALCTQAARRPRFRGRLWAYLTDIPQRPSEVTPGVLDRLREIAEAAGRLLCQTEDLRGFLGSLLPEASKKLILLPPMIPPPPDPTQRLRLPGGRIFYAGKFAPDWGFLEMVRAFEELRPRHPGLEFHVAGDKVHEPRQQPEYAPLVRAALAGTPGLVWHGGISRGNVQELLRTMDLALSPRHPDRNQSLELSTKILEYGAAGVPVVLNHNPLHEELLGAGYPLFVEGFDELPAVIERGLGDDETWYEAQVRCLEASASFTFAAVYQRLEPYLERLAPTTRFRSGSPRILVAGHDFKFVEDLLDYWTGAGAEVRRDRWQGLYRHDENESRKLADWADVIVCEWCLGNAVWYSQERPPEKPLLVRFHRAEFQSVYPEQVSIEDVEKMVFVAPHVRERAQYAFSWPEDLLAVVPNAVRVEDLDRRKLPGAVFNLGLLGYAPRIKRLDRALDILEAVRAEDPRFHLNLRGESPTSLRWVWGDSNEQEYFQEQFARIATSPLLVEAVSVEGFGASVEPWFRKIGFVLSTSEYESFHLAVAEGMASRAVPVILDRDGVHDLYPAQWVHQNPEQAASSILETVRRGSWRQQGEAARSHVVQHFSLIDVGKQWVSLIDEALDQVTAPSGQESFEDVDPVAWSERVEELLTGPGTESLFAHFRDKQPLQGTYRYSRRPKPTIRDREEAGHLLAGRFRGHNRFPWMYLGVPPPWDVNPVDNRTWDFGRHALEWLVSLVTVAAADGDERCWSLARRVLEDWIESNSKPPGLSRYAWNDHTGAIRLRIICWFWELWRHSDAFEEGLARLLLASVYQHALFMLDERHYRPDSNHGLEMDASLLAAALTFPEFDMASRWRREALRRLVRYVARNFSPEGFHLEQSPSYHSFVLQRLGHVVGFLRENLEQVPDRLERALEAAASVWPYLVRPNHTLPTVGDSDLSAGPREWRAVLERSWGRKVPPAAASSALNARSDGADFLLSFPAGYAIFTAYDVTAGESDTVDTHLLFKCNSFQSTHCHNDALSFVLYGHGRDWLVDSGYLNYEEGSAEREYMRSARAHNVVLVDERDFDYHPCSLSRWARTAQEDLVEARHELPEAIHTRTLRFRPPAELVITDLLEARDDLRHSFTQLFHAAPGLQVELISPSSARLEAGDGRACEIEQLGPGGWTVVTGQREPMQGWFSPTYGELEPAPVLLYASPAPAGRFSFLTRIRLIDGSREGREDR
jgi:glycosyltransferase involved in cell wall biosynthesis